MTSAAQQIIQASRAPVVERDRIRTGRMVAGRRSMREVVPNADAVRTVTPNILEKATAMLADDRARSVTHCELRARTAGTMLHGLERTEDRRDSSERGGG